MMRSEFQLVALTGGIGAGKSTVARALCERGARIIDADAIARDVVDPSTRAGRRVLRSLTDVFGDAILRDEGSLDREAIAARVFEDHDRREQLNAIMHPAIRDATVEAIAVERAQGGVVVHEIPLLTKETGPLPWRYDLIVTVEASIDERVRRLTEIRGYAPDHARARISAQGDEQARTAIADVVLRNDGSLNDTLSHVDALWRRLSDLPKQALGYDSRE
ncbi:dephospho-CoA kinase [Agromyces sp. NPDC058484]|uniref:dephospho-CoA kinase n=1 Tax=Agromyces sp. NPDC058484 TaxID=3346524 RepID=UPI0036683BA4